MLNNINIKQILKEEINKTTQKRFSDGVSKYVYNKIYSHLKKIRYQIPIFGLGKPTIILLII